MPKHRKRQKKRRGPVRSSASDSAASAPRKSIVEQLCEQRERHRLAAAAKEAKEAKLKADAKSKAEPTKSAALPRKGQPSRTKARGQAGISAREILERQIKGKLQGRARLSCVRQRIAHLRQRGALYDLVHGALWGEVEGEHGLDDAAVESQIDEQDLFALCLHQHRERLGGPAGRLQSLSSFHGANQGGAEVVARLGSRNVSLSGVEDTKIRAEMRVDQGGPNFGLLQYNSIQSSVVRHVPCTYRVLWGHSFEGPSVTRTRLRVDGLDRFTSASLDIKGLVAGLSITSSSSCMLTMSQSYSRAFCATHLDLENLKSIERAKVESSTYASSFLGASCVIRQSGGSPLYLRGCRNGTLKMWDIRARVRDERLHGTIWPHRRQRPSESMVSLPTVVSLCPLHRRGLAVVGCSHGDVTLVDPRQPREAVALVRRGGFATREKNPKFAPAEVSVDVKERIIAVNEKTGFFPRLFLCDVEDSLLQKERPKSDRGIWYQSYQRRDARYLGERETARIVRLSDVQVTERGDMLAFAQQCDAMGSFGSQHVQARFVRISVG